MNQPRSLVYSGGRGRRMRIGRLGLANTVDSFRAQPGRSEGQGPAKSHGSWLCRVLGGSAAVWIRGGRSACHERCFWFSRRPLAGNGESTPQIAGSICTSAGLDCRAVFSTWTEHWSTRAACETCGGSGLRSSGVDPVPFSLLMRRRLGDLRLTASCDFKRQPGYRIDKLEHGLKPAQGPLPFVLSETAPGRSSHPQRAL